MRVCRAGEACQLTWRWCTHCAPAGATPEGCHLWPPLAGNGAALQKLPQGSLRFQSPVSACLHSCLSALYFASEAEASCACHCIPACNYLSHVGQYIHITISWSV